MYKYEEVNKNLISSLKSFKALEKYSDEWEEYRRKFIESVIAWKKEVEQDSIKIMPKTQADDKFFRGSVRTIKQCNRLIDKLNDLGCVTL